jgi:predicted DNA-binding helix-hairpin-helix protein
MPMVTLEKIAHLAEDCRFDSMGRAGGVDAKKPLPGICHAFTRDGRCISLFKTLYTNRCSHQCSYCTNAANCSSKSRAFSYTPQELARITISLYRSNYIEGLFLSSGAGQDEECIMERMIETTRLLRQKFAFFGYIHLKVLPGSSRAHIREAAELANRVSINLEASSASRMLEICATKNYESDILQRQRYIRDMKSESSDIVKPILPSGQTTQLVVGAAGESDEEIFERILYEYEEIGVRRAYYSAFSPQRGTLFENRKAQPLWREHRLYQMDWLYRVYHFQPGEIRYAFGENGNLCNADPKTAIAREFMDRPLDPNAASFRELLRVPGIGPGSAQRILACRKRQPIAAKSELAAMGVRIKKAAAFLKINGWRDTTLEMWQA